MGVVVESWRRLHDELSIGLELGRDQDAYSRLNRLVLSGLPAVERAWL